MELAVIIPAFNEEARIKAAIQSAQQRAGEGAQPSIIVADGQSTDSTVLRAREAEALVITAPQGRAAQLQAGAEAAAKAGAQAVLFLHADSTPPRGYAAAIQLVLADPQAVGGAFGFAFAETGRRPALRLIERGVQWRLRLAALPYGDQGIFARAGALAKIGGVPQVPIMEDVNLVRALQKTGPFVQLQSPCLTSARRYLQRGIARTVMRNSAALALRAAGLSHARIAAWVQR